MSVILYDIILLVIFLIFIGTFLYKRRKNVKREGLMLLYRTRWGMNLIEKVGGKYKKTLRVLSYFVVATGYILMGVMIYLFGKIVWVYVLNPEIVQAIKIPPIMPLVPYLPQVLNLDFLPAFYFTYWIIIIAIVAGVHEFAHGIFMRRYGIKIKSTGFGFFPFFFPIFPLAFVEQDEKNMEKKKIFPQLSVLAAGTFTNLVTAIIFFGIMWLFFIAAFSPAGVTFDTYTYSIVNVSTISSVNGISLENPTAESIYEMLEDEELTGVVADGEEYFLNQDFYELQEDIGDYILLYDDEPAINAGLEGAITEINGESISSLEELSEALEEYSPGDEIIITTINDGEEEEFTLILGANPSDEDAAYLGIGFTTKEYSGLMGFLVKFMYLEDYNNVYYEAKFGAADFIYYLLWWLVMVSFSLALINMLPVGIFDGGKFFYLTILAITKKENIAKKTFSIITYIFILLLFVTMAFWVMSFF